MHLYGVDASACGLVSSDVTAAMECDSVEIAVACGSGACAAVVAGVAQNLLIQGEPVKVNLPGGSLSIFWSVSSLQACSP